MATEQHDKDNRHREGVRRAVNLSEGEVARG